MKEYTHHILHIATATTWRGGEQQVAYLVDELNGLGISQSVLCTSGGALETWCRRHGVDVHTARKRISNDPAYVRAVRSVAEKVGATLIHVHDSHAHTLAWLATVLYGNRLPVVVSRRVDFPISKNVLSRKKYNHPIVKRIVCVSDAIKAITAPDISNPAVLVTVHDGTEIGRYQLDKKGNKLREEFNIPADYRLIGNVAALADHKDYFTFVNTAAILLKNNKNLHFFAIGDGPVKGEISNYIRNLALGKHITLTGFRNDVPEILPELDVFLFTSKTEGLGSAVLESLASGVPVVATRAGGVPEVIKNGVNGLLAPVGDAAVLAAAVERVLGDADLRQTLIDVGRTMVADFSTQRMAERTLAVYESVAAEVWS